MQQRAEHSARAPRTNATAMAEAMTTMATGAGKVALVGGGREILALAEAAITLKDCDGPCGPLPGE